MCYKQEKKKNKKYFSQVETSKAKNKLTQRVETKKKHLQEIIWIEEPIKKYSEILFSTTKWFSKSCVVSCIKIKFILKQNRTFY